MRKLLTHYQLASIIESKLERKANAKKQRLILRDRILDAMHDITDNERANVLTCNLWKTRLQEIERLNNGNAVRRSAKYYAY